MKNRHVLVGACITIFVLLATAIVGGIYLSRLDIPQQEEPTECPQCGNQFIHGIEVFPLTYKKSIGCYLCGWEWK